MSLRLLVCPEAGAYTLARPLGFWRCESSPPRVPWGWGYTLVGLLTWELVDTTSSCLCVLRVARLCRLVSPEAGVLALVRPVGVGFAGIFKRNMLFHMRFHLCQFACATCNSVHHICAQHFHAVMALQLCLACGHAVILGRPESQLWQGMQVMKVSRDSKRLHLQLRLALRSLFAPLDHIFMHRLTRLFCMLHVTALADI